MACIGCALNLIEAPNAVGQPAALKPDQSVDESSATGSKGVILNNRQAKELSGLHENCVRSGRPVATGLRLLSSLALAVSGPLALAQRAVPVDTGNARVDRLLGQMTLAEKLTLIHDGREDPSQYQGQAGYVGGVSRLAIPGLRLADGPPGVLTRHPSQAETATMCVAATFDVRLAEENGVVIGREARALGIDVSLQPYVNIDRDIAFKRAYITFGEDPLLTSRMGAAEIRGIQ